MTIINPPFYLKGVVQRKQAVMMIVVYLQFVNVSLIYAKNIEQNISELHQEKINGMSYTNWQGKLYGLYKLA